MRANNTIYFAVRASKSRQNGMCPIQVQLTKNGERASFTTGKVVSLLVLHRKDLVGKTIRTTLFSGKV